MITRNRLKQVITYYHKSGEIIYNTTQELISSNNSWANLTIDENKALQHVRLQKYFNKSCIILWNTVLH